MIKLITKIRSSVGIKLALPVVASGLIMLIVVVVFETIQGQRVTEKLIEKEARYIIDTLAIIAEVDSNEDNLRRVVFSLSANEDVVAFYLFDDIKKNIIASHDRLSIGEPIELVLKEQWAGDGVESSDNYGLTPERINAEDKYVVAHSIKYIDRKLNKFGKYHVYLILESREIKEVVSLQVVMVSLVLLFGITIAVFSSLFALQKYVKKPIHLISNAIMTERHSRNFSVIDETETDEIGVLASAYNQLVLSNQAREKSLNLQAAELEEAKNIADNASLSKSQFLASMSHEIRTPMNGVIGMLNLLEKSKLDLDQKHKFRLAKSSAESLLTLINDILDFSKIEAGKLELENIDFDLTTILGDLSESMAIRAEENNLQLHLDLTGVKASRVKGDPTRIRQVVTNLVGNAIKFTDIGTVSIRIQLDEVDANNFRLTGFIEDTGIGIAPDKQRHLFDSFTQEDASTTRKYGGTGLGLAISRLLCEIMGGAISVTSTLGKGSCFKFELMLEKSAQSRELKPCGNVYRVRVIIVSKSNLTAIENQLTDWGVQAECVSSLNDLFVLLDFCSIEYISTAVFVDHLFVRGTTTPFPCQFRHIPNRHNLKIILMRSISDASTHAQLSSIGFFHSFPLPATKADLILAMELLSGEVGLDSLAGDHNANPEQSENALPLKKLRLLLVEDNPINQEVALGLLDDLPVVAECADNGIAAIKKMFSSRNTNCYDMILMDCQMPDMDGFECTRLIRQGEAGAVYSNVPIIALTANAMQGDKERCLAAGMNDYLSKPINYDLLERAILKWSQVVNDDHVINEAEKVVVTEHSHQDVRASDDVQGNVANGAVDEILVWNQEEALSRVRGKPERLVRLSRRFLEAFSGDVSELKDASEARDFDRAKRAAHTIKGVAANMSANTLKDVAHCAEQAADHQNVVELSAQIERVFEAGNDVSAMLERYVQDNEATA